MMKKKELERRVYIEDDLTRKKREVQGIIRRAKEEREKGKEVKMGYMKVKIGEKWMKWNEMEECLKEERRGGERRQGKEEKKRKGERGLRMCFWNVAGVLNKDKDMWEYLEDFEVVGLTETWLEEDKWENIKNKLPKSLE